MFYSYLQIDGIEGEVDVAPYVGWIDVYSYNVSKAIAGGFGSGMGASSIVNEIDLVTVTVDKSYPRLKLAVDTGKHIKSATLVAMEKPEGPPHFTMHIADLIVSGLSLASDPSIKGTRVNLTLSFATGEATQGHTTWRFKTH